MILNPCLHAGGGFIPSDLPSLLRWWNADVNTYGYTDFELAAVGWPDINGNSTTLIGTDVYYAAPAADYGNRNAYRFYGSGSVAETGLLIEGPITVIAVVRPEAGSQRALFGSSSTALAGNASGRRAFVTNIFSTFIGSNSVSSGIPLPQDAWSIVRSAWSGTTNGECQAFVNGSGVKANVPGLGKFNGFNIADYPAISDFYGQMGQVLLFNEVLSDVNMALVEAYFTDYYNL